MPEIAWLLEPELATAVAAWLLFDSSTVLPVSAVVDGPEPVENVSSEEIEAVSEPLRLDWATPMADEPLVLLTLVSSAVTPEFSTPVALWLFPAIFAVLPDMP